MNKDDVWKLGGKLCGKEPGTPAELFFLYSTTVYCGCWLNTQANTYTNTDTHLFFVFAV